MRGFAFLLIVLLLSPGFALARGVALVIGNADYANVSVLDNPGNDAAAVASALERQGFEVLKRTDLNRVEMRNTLRDFRRLADGADVALVYYAGHGIEIGGVNYLVPVDARLEDERDAGLEMVEVDLILRQISGAGKLKMVVLDACRNNPFVVKMKREETGRNVGSGLGRIEYAEADTLIAYAAAAGEITPDGQSGGNSPFTLAFVNALQGPPADVRRLLGRARDELRQSVPGAAPFVYTSLGGGELIINPLSPQAPAPQQTTATDATGGSISADFVRIDRDGTWEDWNDFLTRWEGQSDHPLYAFALEKREALKTTAPASGSTVEPDVVASDVVASVAPVAVPEPVTGQADRQPAAVEPPDPVTPEVAPRTRDEAARALQEVLRDRGCYRGGIDGILGRGSQRGLTTLGGEIGRDLPLASTAPADEIEAMIAVLNSHPGTQCPAVTVRTQPPKKTTTSGGSTAPVQAKPAATAAPESKPESGSQNYGRKDATKLVPYAPSDCIGNSRKWYDCD